MADSDIPIGWILLVQAGDRRALARLFERIQDRLLAYLVRLLADEHLAEDVLQEVFVLVWRKIAWLREPEFFWPWVYRIASREAFRRLKRERFWSSREGPELLELLPETDSWEPVSPDCVEQLSGQLAEISPGSRAVLLLHYLEGSTLEEVADVLELSLGTVKSRLAYGLATLRHRLRNKENTHERKDD